MIEMNITQIIYFVYNNDVKLSFHKNSKGKTTKYPDEKSTIINGYY